MNASAANGASIRGPALERFVSRGINAAHGRHVERRRQIAHHRIQHRLDAPVAQRAAKQDRHKLGFNGAASQRGDDHGGVHLVVVEVKLGNVVVEFTQRFQQLQARHDGHVRQIVRDSLDRRLGGPITGPHDGLHVDQIDHALEILFAANRELNRHRIRSEALADGADRRVGIGPNAIHLVDEGHARHVVLVGLTPDGLGLRLHAMHGVEDHQSAIQDAQRSLDLGREVHVSGRVDDVDAAVPPVARGGRRHDGDAALTLLRHPVHLGRAIVNDANAMDASRIEEDALGRGRLAGIDVGDDADVASLRDVRFGHG